MLASQEIGDLPERIFAANDADVVAEGNYVLVVLNRALRYEDNAVLDAAIAHANTLNVGVAVYSELIESVAYASDRLFYFALGAFRDLATALQQNDMCCVQTVVKTEKEKTLLAQLIDYAAAIYTDEDHTHWDKVKLNRILSLSKQAVYFVDASRLVPVRVLPEKIRTTPAFRKASGEAREHYAALRDKVLDKKLTVEGAIDPDALKLPAEHNFADYSNQQLSDFVAKCDINHSIEISTEHPPTQAEIKNRIKTLQTKILAKYKWIRNNAALEHSTSEMSPYLHFGMLGPHQLWRAIEASEVPKTYTWKFRDESFTWREWSHYQAFYTPNLHEFEALPNSAKKTMIAHAEDERSEVRSHADILSGNTPDPTWNAAQREWLNTGWLHNNLRMYWAKQLLRFTETPQDAWNLACEINDYISLDGRDPATYASMQWAFGNAKPGYSEKPIYGWVAPKSDRAILKRKGMAEWIAARLPEEQAAQDRDQQLELTEMG